MLRKALIAMLAMSAVTAAAPAVSTAATTVNGTVAMYDARSIFPSYWEISVDCATMTFTGSAGAIYTGWGGAHRDYPAGTTMSGSIRPDGLAVLIQGAAPADNVNRFYPADGSNGSTNFYYQLREWVGSGLVYWTAYVYLPESCRRFPAVTTAGECKGLGWKSVSSENDTAFKNQGDCVSYVTTKGANAPAGS